MSTERARKRAYRLADQAIAAKWSYFETNYADEPDTLEALQKIAADLRAASQVELSPGAEASTRSTWTRPYRGVSMDELMPRHRDLAKRATVLGGLSASEWEELEDIRAEFDARGTEARTVAEDHDLSSGAGESAAAPPPAGAPPLAGAVEFSPPPPPAAGPTGERFCECFGALAGAQPTHGGPDDRRYCDFCGWPLEGQEPAAALEGAPPPVSISVTCDAATRWLNQGLPSGVPGEEQFRFHILECGRCGECGGEPGPRRSGEARMTDACYQLAPFYDGELPPAEAGAYRKHLAGCTECQDALNDWTCIEALHARRRDRTRRAEVLVVVLFLVASAAALVCAGGLL